MAREGLRPLLLLEDSALPVFAGAPSPSPALPADSVLVGPAPTTAQVGLAPQHFNYDRLNEAFLVLKGGGRLIAVNKSRWAVLVQDERPRYLAAPGGLVLGAGAAVAALEYSADCRAEVVGKPTEAFFRLAVAALGVEGLQAGEVLMVGDDVRDDVLGAQAAGLRGALVQTGKYQAGDEGRAEGLPDAVLPSLLDVVRQVVAHLV